jgi:hypothetical protein
MSERMFAVGLGLDILAKRSKLADARHHLNMKMSTIFVELQTNKPSYSTGAPGQTQPDTVPIPTYSDSLTSKQCLTSLAGTSIS